MSATRNDDVIRQSAGETSSTATRPDVWIIPGTGQEWCDCGEDHDLTRAEVAERFALEDETSDGRVLHATVVRVIKDLWQLASVCRFFHLNVEAAAEAVVGGVKDSYVVDDAIDITGLFTKTWQGCPEESCLPIS